MATRKYATNPSNLSEETEIVMLTNTTENVELDNNRKAILDMNNYKITGSFAIEDGAKLFTENGTINSVTKKSVSEVFETLNILNGSYGAGVVSYGGNVILENCNVSNKGDTTFTVSI